MATNSTKSGRAKERNAREMSRKNRGAKPQENSVQTPNAFQEESESAKPEKTRAEFAAQDARAMSNENSPQDERAPQNSLIFRDAAPVSRQTWAIAAFAVLACAALLRLVALEINPMHHDEGVNGFFLLNLMRSGVYHYDPANYHGPTLYYFTLPVAVFFDRFAPSGLTTFAVRFVPAIFGVITVALLLAFRRNIGSIAALTAAALICVSPGCVYVSRYFIHEMLFVCFALGIVVAALRYYETGRLVYMTLGAISAALFFATKETAFITVGVLLIALALTKVYFDSFIAEREAKTQTKSKGRKANRPTETIDRSLDARLARFGGASQVFIHALVALAVFAVVYVLFYSSFGSNWKGVADSFETFKIWSRTGSKDHAKPLLTYVRWLKDEECALFALACLGALFAVVRARSRFAVFCALWAFGALAAYSLIKYKTPWLALNFIVPMAIVAGYGLQEIYKWLRENQSLTIARAVFFALLTAALGFGLYQTIQLNFYHYDDDSYIYVYAHTQRDFLNLIHDVDAFAARTGLKENATITVDAPEYWPLPWYLRDYKTVAYLGRIGVSANPDALVITSDAQSPEFESHWASRYEKIGTYRMRPGVTLALYARRDLLPRG